MDSNIVLDNCSVVESLLGGFFGIGFSPNWPLESHCAELADY